MVPLGSRVCTARRCTLISTSVSDPTGYGRVITDAAGDVLEIVEHKSCSPEQLKVRVINSGIYCLRADLVWSNVNLIQPNPGSGEYYLTDIFEKIGRAHV